MSTFKTYYFWGSLQDQLINISKEHKEIFSAIEKMYTPNRLKILDNNIYEWFSAVDVSEGERETEDTFTKFFKDLNIEIGQDIEEKKGSEKIL